MLRLRGIGRLARAATSFGWATATMSVVALTAAACGSSAPQAFHPAGKPSATPSKSAATGQFPFPADIHIEFQSAPPMDPRQSAVLATDRNFQLAFYYAQYTQGKDTRFNDYIAPIARAVAMSVQSNVAPYIVDHKTIRGTLRFYRTTVEPVDGAPQNMTVTNCVDDSRLPDINARTGERIVGSPAPSSYYTLESDAFKPLGGGKWGLIAITTHVYPQGQSKECKP